jgi:hypothetical protein
VNPGRRDPVRGRLTQDTDVAVLTEDDALAIGEDGHLVLRLDIERASKLRRDYYPAEVVDVPNDTVVDTVSRSQYYLVSFPRDRDWVFDLDVALPTEFHRDNDPTEVVNAAHNSGVTHVNLPFSCREPSKSTGVESK